MRVPYDWLKKFIGENLPPANELSSMLTLQGPEVETVEHYPKPPKGWVIAKIIEKNVQHGLDEQVSLFEFNVETGSQTYKVLSYDGSLQPGMAVIFGLSGDATNRQGAFIEGILPKSQGLFGNPQIFGWPSQLPSTWTFSVSHADPPGKPADGLLTHDPVSHADPPGKPADGLLTHDPVSHADPPGKPADGLLTHDSVSHADPPGTSADGLLTQGPVLVLSITADRSDLLSIEGVAREIAAGCSIPFHPLSHMPFSVTNDVPVPKAQIDDSEFCAHYCCREIRGLTLGPSPFWLQQTLYAINVNSVNNVIDATNLILHEMGQPLHAYDKKALEGSLHIRKARDGERIIGLDSKERILLNTHVVISDEKKPIALAGIMGGTETGVSESTTDIVLESAWFVPHLIRETAQHFRIRTESSYRFERVVDEDRVKEALDRVTALILSLAGGEAGGIFSSRSRPQRQNTRCDFEHSLIERTLGYDIAEETVKEKLVPLGFSAELKDGRWTVCVPSSKWDINRPVDIISELARMNGYSMIPAHVPSFRINSKLLMEPRDIVPHFRSRLVGHGLTEVVNDSWASTNFSERFVLSELWGDAIAVNNPQTKERPLIRQSLLEGIIRSLNINIRQNIEESFACFESGRVCVISEGEVDEFEALAFGLCGRCDPVGPHQSSRMYDYFDLKGTVESVLQGFDISFSRPKSPAYPPLLALHPYRQEYIFTENMAKVGFIGELHPTYQHEDGFRHRVYVCELRLDLLKNASMGLDRLKVFGRNPWRKESLSLIVSDEVENRDLTHTINHADKRIAYCLLSDVYSGEPIPEGKKSLTYDLAFFDALSTLGPEESFDIRAKILHDVAHAHKAILREG